MKINNKTIVAITGLLCISTVAILTNEPNALWAIILLIWLADWIN